LQPVAASTVHKSELTVRAMISGQPSRADNTVGAQPVLVLKETLELSVARAASDQLGQHNATNSIVLLPGNRLGP
jgi:hypothetical protein